MIPATMLAARHHRYGDPDVLQVDTVDVPRPGPREVLVRVHGASVNPSDALFRSGRLRFGARLPRGTGLDLAGEVAAVGEGVDDLTVGDRVWGYRGGLPKRLGTMAEYAVMTAGRCAPAPAAVDLVAAAALPTVGLTALQVLRDALRVRPGDRVLIVGASGGVGSAAVQLAAAMGATVVAVAGPGNADLCRDLGAADVWDHTALPEPAGCGFDAVADLHGARVRDYRRLLRRDGRMATTATRGVPFALASTVLRGPRVRVVQVKARRDDLATLARHVDDGTLRPVVERRYPLERIAAAHHAAETGHARGKRVIELA
ncbi:NAD(P)-dependent alcohol dehydrogenase [Jiangella sp. DSM 45060]|uniref:NAD(P)-dependent alcohol dehydrogenase n=1 Tax=Jiangella sp. DSM 45060 TaxID=1798224 RepID=UPI00087B7CA4|nr:NAD(P)-dependent alcohol dehydrogenase [Jiangella sp. DSM 45060]SDS22968.1 NADPH:quinone reductase [Jiangella sp. DSM 45060]